MRIPLIFLTFLLIGAHSIGVSTPRLRFETIVMMQSYYDDATWKSVYKINEVISLQCHDCPIKIPIKVIDPHSLYQGHGLVSVMEVLVADSECSFVDFRSMTGDVTAARCPAIKCGNQALIKLEIWEKPWGKYQRIAVRKLKNVPNDAPECVKIPDCGNTPTYPSATVPSLPSVTNVPIPPNIPVATISPNIPTVPNPPNVPIVSIPPNIPTVSIPPYLPTVSIPPNVPTVPNPPNVPTVSSPDVRIPAHF